MSPEGALPASVEIFDTTLRDGAQFEGISLTVDDKLRVAEQLDWLGVHWIEGGYPQANPKDAEFFRRAPAELALTTAELVAFGSTRRPLGKVDVDPTLTALVEAGTSTICIVGKSSDFHVTEALRTTLDEGVAMVAESVEFLVGADRRVFFDAEHFFDGYKANPEYALRVHRGGGHPRRRLRGAVRHQRRFAAPRGAADHRRGDGLPGGRRPGRHPHPERLGVRGGQLARRRAGRRHPGAGHGERLRRAHRERQPHDGDPRPDPQAGDRDPAAGPARAPHVGEPPRGRAGQPATAPGGPLRGDLGVRPQGGAAHLRPRPGRRRHLRAHRPRPGGQPHPGAGVGPRRPCRHGHEGHRAGRRARRSGRGRPQRGAEGARGPAAGCSRRPTPRSSC